MPIFGVKSSFLELGILAVQKRELIIEEVHNISSILKRMLCGSRVTKNNI